MLFSMLLTLLCLYIGCVLLVVYWTECHLYIYSILSLSTRCDNYSTSFFILLLIVSGCIGLWSYYYMVDEISFTRFTLLLFSFIMRMVVLIFMSNLFMTLIGWDLLGVTSFLLVVFYKNRKRLGSGIITALTNRFGDGLLFCVLGLFLTLGYFYLRILLLMLIRITKRAQIPFSAWLPAAMAAPTPVRALVHSSTLVTAGVYLLIRYCSVDPFILLYFGLCTIILAGIRACVERDLKKVVALRTLSQLGVIIISIGALEKAYSFFHLISHATFKALLFICIGTCIHTVYGTQDYRGFNSLSSTGVIGVLRTVANTSLLGFIFLSGFYSKEMILERMYEAEGGAWALTTFLLGVCLTTCYSVKLLLCTFTVGSFTRTRSSSMGGNSWAIKAPLYLLGTIRTTFGATVVRFRGLLFVTISQQDKFLPLGAILFGASTGYFMRRFNRPSLRRMGRLVPTTQFLSWGTLLLGRQKHIDKGWVEAGALSLSSISLSVVCHYRAAVRLGLRSIFLFFILCYV